MSPVAGEALQGQGQWRVKRVQLPDTWPEVSYHSKWLAWRGHGVDNDFCWFYTWREAYAYAYVSAYGTPEAQRHMVTFINDGNRVSPTYLDRLGIG